VISDRCIRPACQYSEMHDGSNGVSLKPVAQGMAEFWASTGGCMAGYAFCWSTCDFLFGPI